MKNEELRRIKFCLIWWNQFVKAGSTRMMSRIVWGLRQPPLFRAWTVKGRLWRQGRLSLLNGINWPLRDICWGHQNHHLLSQILIIIKGPHLLWDNLPTIWCQGTRNLRCSACRFNTVLDLTHWETSSRHEVTLSRRPRGFNRPVPKSASRVQCIEV